MHAHKTSVSVLQLSWQGGDVSVHAHTLAPLAIGETENVDLLQGRVRFFHAFLESMSHERRCATCTAGLLSVFGLLFAKPDETDELMGVRLPVSGPTSITAEEPFAQFIFLLCARFIIPAAEAALVPASRFVGLLAVEGWSVSTIACRDHPSKPTLKFVDVRLRDPRPDVSALTTALSHLHQACGGAMEGFDALAAAGSMLTFLERLVLAAREAHGDAPTELTKDCGRHFLTVVFGEVTEYTIPVPPSPALRGDSTPSQPSTLATIDASTTLAPALVGELDPPTLALTAPLTTFSADEPSCIESHASNCVQKRERYEMSMSASTWQPR